MNPLQALWDANGAAIYEANKAFKTKYGRNMSAKVRRKAIKDATRNGHFNAGAYAGNLNSAHQASKARLKADASPTKQEDDPYAGIGNWVEKQDEMNAIMLVSTKLQYDFGIRTQGYNTSATLRSILEAANLTGAKLQDMLGGTPEEAFKKAHGEMEMVWNPDAVFLADAPNKPAEGNCETVSGIVTCRDVYPNVPNTIHEFGHALENYQLKYGSGNKASDLDKVDIVGGGHLDWDDTTDSWLRKTEGFIAGNKSLENKIDIDNLESRTNGYAKQEQFADMYMNWILDGNPDYPNNGFTNDDIGNARRKYMGDQQVPWIFGID